MTTSILWTQGLTISSSLQRIRSITFTNKCLSCSSRVGDIRRGRIQLNRGPAPKSRAFIVICLRADFRIGGVPFFIFNSNIIIFLSFCSLRLNSSSLTSFKRAPKQPTSSGLMLGKALDYIDKGVYQTLLIIWLRYVRALSGTLQYD